jgi:hypothetical protein
LLHQARSRVALAGRTGELATYCPSVAVPYSRHRRTPRACQFLFAPLVIPHTLTRTHTPLRTPYQVRPQPTATLGVHTPAERRHLLRRCQVAARERCVMATQQPLYEAHCIRAALCALFLPLCTARTGGRNEDPNECLTGWLAESTFLFYLNTKFPTPPTPPTRDTEQQPQVSSRQQRCRKGGAYFQTESTLIKSQLTPGQLHQATRSTRACIV